MSNGTAQMQLGIVWKRGRKLAIVFLFGPLVVYLVMSFRTHYHGNAPRNHHEFQAFDQEFSRSQEDPEDELERSNCLRCPNFASEFGLIRSLTSLFWTLDMNLILAEPKILLNFVSPWKRRAMKEFYSSLQFNKQLLTFLVQNNTFSIRSLNNVSPLLKCELADFSNYFCKYSNSTYVIFLVVYVATHDAIKFEPVTKIPKNFRTVVSKNELFLGHHKGSVSWYGHHLTKQDIFVPKYFSNFLLQLRYSQYVSCNKSAAASLQKSFPIKAKPNPDFEMEFKSYLKEMKRITRIMGIPFWTMSGTTLGWMRQCGVIGYTKDVDFGMWASDHSSFLEHLLESSHLLKPRWSFGTAGNGYVLRAGDHLDLYFLYQEGNNKTWIGTYDAAERTVYRSYFPMFTLCSADIFYTRILVPCNAKDMVVAEYGNDWLHPKEKYDYLRDAKNVQLLKKCNESEWKTTMRVFAP